MEVKMLNRRKLLKGTVVLGSGLSVLGAKAFGQGQQKEICSPILTGGQPEGPFYPEIPVELWEPDSDLTRVENATEVAKGEVIHLSGKISDVGCHPINKAEIQIWQADYQGVYQHSRDPRAELITPDANFQFWGSITVNADGIFHFKTIKPGAYPAGGTWIRPQHIHLKVFAEGFLPLTSQLYFEPSDEDVYDLEVLKVNPPLVKFYQDRGGKAVTRYLHAVDGILSQVPEQQRNNVIMQAVKATNGHMRYEIEIKLLKQ